MPLFSRRQLLASTAAALVAPSVSFPKSDLLAAVAASEADATVLRVENRTIDVLGQPAKVYGLLQPDGRSGMASQARDRFRVRLENRTGTPTLIHWHGLLPPYGQGGVPDLPQALLSSGRSYAYDFPLETPGTHWMHAHTLQEQQLLAAPLIIEDPTEMDRDEQTVVAPFHDFSFKTPEEILAGLRGAGGIKSGHGDVAGMADHGMASMPMDINDIEYDAYLANDRTLDDPEVFRVEAGGRVRLRLINGATATAFWIDLGDLGGQAIAVDGNPIKPIVGSRFPLGMGQRLDIRLQLPSAQRSWPILGLREGAFGRTGFVRATKDAAVRRLASRSGAAMPALDTVFEERLEAKRSLPEKMADRSDAIILGGDMDAYVWTLDGRTWERHRPIRVSAGERAHVTLRNQSMMGHPMHLHGHHLQVIAIDGRPVAGAVRDTVWIPPSRNLTVAFDAANSGVWAFHCHHLCHMATGMMTSVEYDV